MSMGSTGLIGYGTGPAGKSRKNTIGPSPAPKIIELHGHPKTPKSWFQRGFISRGKLGKRGR